MSKLSRKQRAEIASIEEFIPSWCSFEPITDEDIRTFLNWSDKGIPYSVTEANKLSGLAALHYGKQYRDLHVTMYREDIEKGNIGKWEILDEQPETVRPWMQAALKGAGPGEDVYELWKGLDNV